ncbi:hypothetical protein [Flavobacterium sp.]
MKKFAVLLVLSIIFLISCSPDEIENTTTATQVVDPTTIKPPTGG